MPCSGTGQRNIGQQLLHSRGHLLLRMDLIPIYQCFCDRTRLRILHLLMRSPLCVCHIQEILDEPQVKISKHLGYLRSRGMVTTAREQNWIIYSLPRRRVSELEKNLRCLQDCVQTDTVFKRDLVRLARLRQTCCEPGTLFRQNANRRKTNAKTKNSIHLRP
jgi:ArsR family transcriptional regulator